MSTQLSPVDFHTEISYLKDPERVCSDEVVADASLRAPRTKLVRDMRPNKDNFKLDTHGFQVLHLPYRERNDKDIKEIQTAYYKEIEEVLRKEIGVKHVFCFAPVLRPLDLSEKPIPNTQKTIPRPHLDFGPKSASEGWWTWFTDPELQAAVPRWLESVGADLSDAATAPRFCLLGGRNGVQRRVEMGWKMDRKPCISAVVPGLWTHQMTDMSASPRKIQIANHFPLQCLASGGSGPKADRAAKPRPAALLNYQRCRFRPAEDGPFTFTQRTTHLSTSLPAGFNATFEQRYWLDLAKYSKGHPVLIVDAADKPGEDTVGLIEQGIVSHIADDVEAAIMVLEQRYYGRSFVTQNLSTASLQFLNMDEALADMAYFAEHFPYDQHSELDASILPVNAPWISYGHWIAGSKAALLRKMYPKQLWGAIASSAPLLAIQNVWQYLEAIRLRADPLCIQVVTTVVADIDDEIDRAGLDEDGEIIINEPLARYREMFNLGTEKTVRDFMNQVATPLGLWQRRSWDERQQDNQAWEYFCANLTQGISLEETADSQITKGDQESKAVFHSRAMENYAYYIRHYLAVGHQRETPQLSQARGDDMFAFGEIRRNKTEAQKTDLGQVWRLWYWQACTEWGYFSAAEPFPLPAVLSRSLSEFYLTEVCRFAYGFPDDYNVTVDRINKYGGVTLHDRRLLFVNGEDDPWLHVTAHSPLAGDMHTKLGDGHLLRQGGFANDRTALPKLSDEPAEIRFVHEKEIEAVRAWVAEWEEKIEEGTGEL
ncbi:extracellular serine carboxypeptidase [Stemphylium lycopersici]|nr:peptidase s28 [Stemphylium lycopersici]RAR00232.1 extracellular serine carboxypeptidase [Stemphylium lycopersici]